MYWENRVSLINLSNSVTWWSYHGTHVAEIQNWNVTFCRTVKEVWGIPDERKNTSEFPLIPTVPGPAAIANRLTTEKAPLITPKPKPDTVINDSSNSKS